MKEVEAIVAVHLLDELVGLTFVGMSHVFGEHYSRTSPPRFAQGKR